MSSKKQIKKDKKVKKNVPVLDQSAEIDRVTIPSTIFTDTTRSMSRMMVSTSSTLRHGPLVLLF
ncbi:MAG: hypothetical protein Q8755_03345, partial [Candidatus Phytoplasma australasiaticum]|nr:hypothetical protein [Candidatus Phytoplasma australasiaticum]